MLIPEQVSLVLYICFVDQEQQEEWVKKLKFHASLPPAKQLTSYSSSLSAPADQEPVYANLPSPPLPNSGPPPSARNSAPTDFAPPPVGFGVAGTRDLLNQKAGSREPIAGRGHLGLL